MANHRQKKAFDTLVEASRANLPKTMGEIMLEAGYAPNTAIKPSQVTKSKGWLELLDEYFPDELLATIGLHGMAALKRDQFSGEMTNDWANIYKFWSEVAERKHPKVAKTEQDITMRVVPILGGASVPGYQRDEKDPDIIEAD